jgi:hypothetical protein
MTDTTKKAMTLEQVRDELRSEAKNERLGYKYGGKWHDKLADAIDAHLAAQRERETSVNDAGLTVRQVIETLVLERDAAVAAAQREGELVRVVLSYPNNRVPFPEMVEVEDASGKSINVPIYDRGDGYKELRLYNARPPTRVEVTKERVERACQTFFVGNVRKPWPWRETQDIDEPDAVFASMRATLEAALSEEKA